MGNGKEDLFNSKPSSSNSPPADIPSTCPNIPNYMHGYYGPMPAWLPAFLSYPSANQYPSNLQNGSYSFQHGMEDPVSRISTSSITSKFQGIEDNRPDGWETESPCTSSRVNECVADRLDAQDNRPEFGTKFTSIVFPVGSSCGVPTAD